MWIELLFVFKKKPFLLSLYIIIVAIGSLPILNSLALGTSKCCRVEDEDKESPLTFSFTKTLLSDG